MTLHLGLVEQVLPSKSEKVPDQVCQEDKVKDSSVPHPSIPNACWQDKIWGAEIKQKNETPAEYAVCCQEISRWGKMWEKNLQMLDRVSHVMWKPCKIPGQEPSVLGRMTERGAMPGCCLVGKREAPTWLGCNTELCHCSSAPGSTTSGTAQSKGHGQDAAKARIANISAAAGDLAQERRSSAIWRVTSALTFSRWGIIFGLSSSTLTIS